MRYRFDARGALLPKFLGFVMVLFIGILIGCYLIAREANPVMLDEHGNVRGAAPQAASSHK
jgi:hypothetical protein